MSNKNIKSLKKLNDKDLEKILKKKYQEVEVPEDLQKKIDRILEDYAKGKMILSEEETKKIIETGVKEKLKEVTKRKGEL